MNQEQIKIINNALQMVTECRYYQSKMMTSDSVKEAQMTKAEYLVDRKKLGNYLSSFLRFCPQLRVVYTDYLHDNYKAMSSKLSAHLQLVNRIDVDRRREHCQKVSKLVGAGALALIGVATVAHVLRKK